MTRKRSLGRLLQKEYWLEHQECEWCGKKPATVHEIFFGADKFYHKDNFISLCQECHDKAHGLIDGKMLTREMLCRAKGVDYEQLRRRAKKIRGELEQFDEP